MAAARVQFSHGNFEPINNGFTRRREHYLAIRIVTSRRVLLVVISLRFSIDFHRSTCVQRARISRARNARYCIKIETYTLTRGRVTIDSIYRQI